jgi:signal peptide peptidase SppA
MKKLKLSSWLYQRAFNTPLLIEPGKARIIADYLERRFGMIDAPSMPMPMPEDDEDPMCCYQIEDIGVIPIIGTLVHRAGAMDADSGLVSYQALREDLTAAANDPSVKVILLDIDSGGGEVEGNFDLANYIREINDTVKPVVAIANGSAYSGAYSLAAAAGNFYVTETGGVGSVGVIIQHVDYSKANEMEGITVTNIVAGDKKGMFSSDFPLSAEAKAELQADVNSTYDMFVSHVAKMRDISEDVVRGTQAGLLSGPDALIIGMVDGIISFDSLLGSIAKIELPTLKQSNQRIHEMSFLKRDKVEPNKEPEKVEEEVSAQPTQDEALEYAAEVAKICTAGGMPEMAAGFIRSKTSIEDVTAKVDLKQGIETACKLAGKSDKAAGFIKAGKTLKEVQESLLSEISDEQDDEISNQPNPEDVTEDFSKIQGNPVVEDAEKRQKAATGPSKSNLQRQGKA